MTELLECETLLTLSLECRPCFVDPCVVSCTYKEHTKKKKDERNKIIQLSILMINETSNKQSISTRII